MTLSLDPPRRCGALVIAALSEQEIVSGAAAGLWFRGTKTPVALLIRREGQTSAFEIDGAPIDAETFELRFPGWLAAFEQLAGA